MRKHLHLHLVLSLFIIIFLILLSPTASALAQNKTIYIAPDDHTDYIWSTSEDGYRQAFVNMLDYYLNLADSTSSNIPTQQSKFVADGSFWLYTYQKNKTAAEFDRLMSRVADGHIGVSLNPLVTLYGAQPAEAVMRGMYYSGKLERQYGVRFPTAVNMENQTMPYGLGALWAGAGAKYSWKGICNCDTQVPNAGDREYDAYWWQGPDNSRILMKWNSMLVNNEHMGGYAEARNPSAIVDFVDTNSGFASRYSYPIIGAFGKGWDDVQTLTNEFVTTAQQKTTPTRNVVVSNEQDYFTHLESEYGPQLPTLGVTFGNEWELYTAAMSEVTAQVRRSVEKLRSAEALATFVLLKNPTFMESFTTSKDQTWMNIGLFWEHNWGMVNSPANLIEERIAWQKRLATEIETYVNTLYDSASTQLAAQINAGNSQNPRFFVFNPLSWTRTEAADVLYTPAGAFHVIDIETATEVPSQLVTIDGQIKVRILATNLPSVGYKVYEIVSGAGQSFPNAATVSSNNIENTAYKLTLSNSGSITSFVDKLRGNREFASTIGGRTINDLGATTGSALQVENIGPVSVTLLATSTAPLSHTSRITLYKNIDRVDIQNDINQNFNTTNTWRFGFNLTNPEVHHEEVGAVIKAKLTSSGGKYSTRNARYDYLTMNHFADMTGSENVGVTISNADLEFMKLGNSTVTNLDTSTPQISVLAGGRVVNGINGLQNQGGSTHFLQRFALRTHDAYNQTAAMKFALEHQNPPTAKIITGTAAAYLNTSYSLLTLSDPDVLLWTLKPAEEQSTGSGIIARVWNMTEATKPLSLQFGTVITAAYQTSHIETNTQSVIPTSNTIPITLATNQLKSYRLISSESTATPSPSPSVTPSPSPTPTATPTATPSPTPTPTVTPTPTPVVSPTPTPTPSTGPDVTYSFSDVIGTGQGVYGIHAGIDFGLYLWAKDASYAGLTDAAYFTVGGVTSRSFTLPANTVLKSIKVSGTNGGTYQISAAGNPTRSGSVINNSPITVTTNWTTPQQIVTVYFSAGWDSVIDDIVYGSVTGPTATPTPTPTPTATPSPTPTPTVTPTPTPVVSPTPTPTTLPTPTPVPTATPTATPSPTPTPTVTPTPTPVVSPTPTPTPNSFPANGVLDTFNRANSSNIGASWTNLSAGHVISANKLKTNINGDAVALWNTLFGTNQEVYVTYSSITSSASEIDLVLKSQTKSFNASMIEVLYQPSARRFQVWVNDTSGPGWVQYGSNISRTLVNGDVVGARASSTGVVTIYVNGVSIATVNVSTWPHNTKGGYIGVWTVGARNTLFDNFGGGNY